MKKHAAQTHTHHGTKWLQHHFDQPSQQFHASKMGMWLFLATEILLFGGLFCAYTVYRGNHPEIFVYAHQYLDPNLGALNTCVLLFSSLTAAWAVRAAQKGQKTLLVRLLAITLLCGFVFMGVKYVEYKHKWQHGLMWGTRYEAQVHGDDSHGAAGSVIEHATPDAPIEVAPPTGSERPEASVGPRGLTVVPEAGTTGQLAHAPNNVQLFFAIYFGMTGLHGIHVIAGMIVLGWLLIRSARGDFGPGYFTPVDLGALYWHLVDMIWVFLFPLLYLIG